MKLSSLIACIILLAQPCSAAWDWYGGDFISYTLYPPNQIAYHFQEALDTHLDYRTMYSHPSEGHFIGLAEFLAQEEFNRPGLLTPIVGTAVALESGDIAICVGVDPRSPIPDTNFQEMVQWAASQGGVALLAQLPDSAENSQNLPAHPLLFQALDSEGWHPHIQMGGKWDSLLTLGYRIGIVGQASPLSHTYIWAESLEPEHLVAGLSHLATIVAEEDAIQADFRVDGHVPGAVVFPEFDTRIRITATARAPIQSIRLISDGELIWSSTPNANTFSTRLQIPIANKRYIRAEFQTEFQHTRTSPIFLASNVYPESETLPFEHLPFTFDGAIESLTHLPTDSQSRILAEFIGHGTTRFPAVRALYGRPDIMSDRIIEALLQSPFPKVRLGSAFVLVMQTEAPLAEQLIQLMADPSPGIQTYAARMLLQYTSFKDAARLKDLINGADAPARAYLIQALDPGHSDQTLWQDLIHASVSATPGVASASMAKLVEMGTRNFRVIRSLRDSASKGHIASLELLGTIGDGRVVNDIEKIYINATPGPLKNTAFRVLQTFYPHQNYYPKRPELRDEGASPILDGIFSAEEWNGAARIDHFVDDADLGKTYSGMNAYVTRDATHILFAVQVPQNGLHPLQRLELSLATGLAPQIPFIFSVPYFASDQSLLDPTLQLIQSLSDGLWFVEGSLGFSDLGLDPTTPIPYLRFNTSLLTENNRWSWTPTYGMPGNPDRFGILHLHTPH
jgi:hypothetical protein